VKQFLTKDKLFLGLLTILYLKLETYLAYKGIFAFTYDQGRDLLEAAKLIFERNITLIGPTTGLPGIFYGPWWYYFLSIPIFVSGGNPTFVAIIFSFIGLATSISLFLFLRYVTNSFFLPAFLAYISLVSSQWMLSPTFIWSPTFVPVFMILMFYSFDKITRAQSKKDFFLYGLSSQIILQGEVAFGVMTTLWLLLSFLIYKKYFFTKKIIWTLAGMFLLWIPQILFELRNNFLELRATIAYLIEPKIYGDKAPIYLRFSQRLDSYYGQFSQTFFNGNKLIALLFIGFITLALFITAKKHKFEKQSKLLVKYLLTFTIFSIMFFTLFQDRIWDYYLIGMPITFVIIISLILKQAISSTLLKYLSILFVILIFFHNLPNSLFGRVNEEKVTDGGTFINAQRVMDFIVSQEPKNYSLYVYSPAIFDPPFDYLIYWYNKKHLIEKPKEKQDTFYLVIREYSSNKYFNSGWYGDKTRDKSTMLEKKMFFGDIVLEKHTFSK